MRTGLPGRGLVPLQETPETFPPPNMGEHPKKPLSVDQETHHTGHRTHLYLHLDRQSP